MCWPFPLKKGRFLFSYEASVVIENSCIRPPPNGIWLATEIMKLKLLLADLQYKREITCICCTTSIVWETLDKRQIADDTTCKKSRKTSSIANYKTLVACCGTKAQLISQSDRFSDRNTECKPIFQVFWSLGDIIATENVVNQLVLL